MSMRSERARRRSARRRNQRIFLGIAIVLILALAVYLAYNAFSGPDTPPSSAAETVTASGLRIQEVSPGSGEQAVVGDTVAVHYSGKLEDGTQFDSSMGGQPIEFTLGQGRVIQGWEEGILGMQVGGKRVLTIPPDLAYGSAGAGGVIPPNATLIFDVELVEIK